MIIILVLFKILSYFYN